ncbi:hypothetical protein M2169_003175 [Streptomyces sp. MJP52]|jgi:hypothetical protein|nr:hypothetical protein [Streptomyces sp. MJP52]
MHYLHLQPSEIDRLSVDRLQRLVAWVQQHVRTLQGG